MRFDRLFLVVLPLLLAPAPVVLKQDECKKTAQLARKARIDEVASGYSLAVANCMNLADLDARKECLKQAKEDRKVALEGVKEENDARLEVCSLLGGGAYDPVIDPSQFSTNITNPLMPLVPGTVFTYMKTNAAGTEVTTFEVTNDTKVVLGVTCRVIHDSVKFNNVLIEDTRDYFAQDAAGNVWYFGELSQEFEGGELKSLEGTWTAGVDGAKPGIVMKATPTVGETYRQEFLLLTAEDLATVLALSVSVTVPFGTFATCLRTSEFSPLDPGVIEEKYYAPGVGMVLEVDLDTGDRTELVNKTP